MESIEQRELRGITLRNLIAVITIVFSIAASYFSIKGELKEIRLERENSDKYNELRLRTIEVNMEAIKLQYRELSSKYDELLMKPKQ